MPDDTRPPATATIGVTWLLVIVLAAWWLGSEWGPVVIGWGAP